MRLHIITMSNGLKITVCRKKMINLDDLCSDYAQRDVVEFVDELNGQISHVRLVDIISITSAPIPEEVKNA